MKRRGWSETRGSVFVEFIIAFLPIHFFFSCLVQLSLIQTASLVVQHDANVVARAAAVVLPDDPAYYNGGDALNTYADQRKTDIQTAARLPLTAIDQSGMLQAVDSPSGLGPHEFAVTLSSTSGGSGQQSFAPDDLIWTSVAYAYPCNIPIGRLVCAAGGGNSIVLHGNAVMPNQGANFAYPIQASGPGNL